MCVQRRFFSAGGFFPLHELMSDLITNTWIEVHCFTLSREERCASRTYPVKATCTSTTHQRAGAKSLSLLHSKNDYSQISELATELVLRARRLCCLRRETVFSPELVAGFSEAGSNGSPLSSFSRGGADRRWGFWNSPHQRVLPGFR